MWNFTSETRWCWDGTEITTKPHFTTDVEVLWPFWSYEGNTELFELGGQGEWYHNDFAMGKFRLCFVGCIESGYAEISKSQYGNGDRTIEEETTMASFGTGLVLVVLVAVFSAMLLTTGRRVLRRNEEPAWHGVGMVEVVVGLMGGVYAILLLLSLPAP